MDESLSCLFSLGFSPGDLVRLVEDDSLSFGLGLVMKVERNIDDIRDLITLFNILHGNIEEVIPSKPQLLVMWNGSGKNIWMYSTDVALYQKAE